MNLQKQMSVSAGTESDKKEKTFENSQHKNYINNIIPQRTQQKSSINCKFYTADIFSRVKDSLDIRQVLESYGVAVNSNHFSSCPFHQENTPSFRAYANSYYCFGCGESGTIIDFVMKYFGLPAIEAAKKLSADFGLHLFSDGNKNWETAMYRCPQESKRLVDNFSKWEKRAFRMLTDYLHALRFWGTQIVVHQCEYFKKYEPEVEYIVFIQGLVDMMIEDMYNFEAQIEFYRNYGEVVTAVEQRLESLNALEY